VNGPDNSGMLTEAASPNRRSRWLASVRLFFGVFALSGFVAAGAAAQEASTEEACKAVLGGESIFCKSLGFTSDDYGVPKSPAFTVLGVTPESVVRPTSPGDLATSVLDGVDPNGNFQTGYALDTNPYMLLAGPGVTLQEYRENYFARLLANTQVSVATAKGIEDDDESVRVAVGLNVTPWSGADPRMDAEHLECLGKAVGTFPDAPPPGPNSTPEQQAVQTEGREKVLLARTKSCHDAFRKRAWNASGWTLGVAPTLIAKSGAVEDIEWSGAAIWTSLALDLGSMKVPGIDDVGGQLVAHVRYRAGELAPDSAGLFFEQDSLLVGAKYRFGGSTFNITGEAAYIMADREGRPDDTYLNYTGKIEFRVFENIWVDISGGSSSGREDSDEVFGLGALKIGFPQKK